MGGHCEEALEFEVRSVKRGSSRAAGAGSENAAGALPVVQIAVPVVAKRQRRTRHPLTRFATGGMRAVPGQTPHAREV